MNFGIESETIEFKKSTAELDSALNSICAMLNKHGFGTIYFGVLPNGEVCGQIVSESTLRDISRRIYHFISPQVIPTIEKRFADGKEIIEVTFKGDDKPYSAKGVYYYRSADEDRVLPPHELRQLFEYNKKDSWDSKVTKYQIDDINEASLEKFFKRATACGRLKDDYFEPQKLLLKLNLLKSDRLTNAAYYLFSKNEPIVLKMAVFATDEKLTFLDINRVSGNIIDLIEIATNYIKTHINWRADLTGLKRIEIPEIPVNAIREIVVNSFAHARYGANSQHEIAIHPGMITIYNPGEFPIGYTPEDFVSENLASIIRNPLLLEVLFLSEDVETYGSGFKRVYHECDINNVKTRYINSRDGFTFIFNRNTVGVNVGVNAGVNTGVNIGVNEEHDVILELIKNNPQITTKMIGQKLNISQRSVQRILSLLKIENRIERIGGTRGYWKVLK